VWPDRTKAAAQDHRADRQRNRLILSSGRRSDWRKTQTLRTPRRRRARRPSDQSGRVAHSSTWERRWIRTLGTVLEARQPPRKFSSGPDRAGAGHHIDPERKRIGGLKRVKRIVVTSGKPLPGGAADGRHHRSWIRRLRAHSGDAKSGLIHISELSDSHIAHPKEVVRKAAGRCVSSASTARAARG
jgi:hypothetical protein